MGNNFLSKNISEESVVAFCRFEPRNICLGTVNALIGSRLIVQDLQTQQSDHCIHGGTCV